MPRKGKLAIIGKILNSTSERFIIIEDTKAEEKLKPKIKEKKESILLRNIGKCNSSDPSSSLAINIFLKFLKSKSLIAKAISSDSTKLSLIDFFG
jgi:hypothetical protein